MKKILLLCTVIGAHYGLLVTSQIASKQLSPQDLKRDLFYLKSSDGDNLQIKLRHIEFFNFIKDGLKNCPGTKDQPLVIPLTHDQFKGLMTNLRDLVDDEQDISYTYESKRYTLEALTEEIRYASQMGCETLGGLAKEAFIGKLKRTENLQKFQNDAQFLSRFEFSDELKAFFGQRILAEEDRSAVRSLLVLQLTGEHGATNVSFNQTSDHIAVSGPSKDGAGFFDVWDINLGEKTTSFKGEKAIHGHNFLMTPLFVTMSEDVVRLWSTITGRLRSELAAKDYNQQNAKFSGLLVRADFSAIVVGLGNTLISWDLRSDDIKVFNGSNDNKDLGRIEFLLEQQSAGIANKFLEIRSSGLIRMWRTDTRECTSQYQIEGAFNQECAKKVFYNDDSRKLALVTSDNRLYIFDCSKGQIERLKQVQLKASALCFNPFGNRLAVAGEENVGGVIDLDTEKWNVLNTGNVKLIQGSYHPNGELLALAAQDSKIYLCETKENRVTASFSFDTPSRGLYFSVDGSMLASTHPDGLIRLLYYSDKQIAAYLAGKRDATSRYRKVVEPIDLPKGLLMLLIVDAKKRGASLDFLKAPHLKPIYETLDEQMIRRFITPQ